MDPKLANELATGGIGVLELGGQSWMIEHTDEALHAFRAWCRKRLRRPLQVIHEDIRDWPPDDRAVAIKAAVALQASGSDLTPEQILDEMTSADGLAFWLFLLTRTQHPEATPATFRPYLEDDPVRFGVFADLESARVNALKRIDPFSPAGNGSPSTSTAPASTTP